MPIKWSAVKVREAMDNVEQQVNLAQHFIDEAHKPAQEAISIPDLPQYMEASIKGVVYALEGTIHSIRHQISRVLADIPDGAIEAERDRTKHGSQQGLI